MSLSLLLRDISVEHCSKKLVKTQRAVVHHVSVANCGLTGLALLSFEASCAAHCGPKAQICSKTSNNHKCQLLLETRLEYAIRHWSLSKRWILRVFEQIYKFQSTVRRSGGEQRRWHNARFWSWGVSPQRNTGWRKNSQGNLNSMSSSISNYYVEGAFGCCCCCYGLYD